MLNGIDTLYSALTHSENILSQSERLLLKSVLQYARDDRFSSEIDVRVAERIAGAVGIVVAKKLLDLPSSSVVTDTLADLTPNSSGLAPSPAGLAPSPAGLAPSPMGMAPSPAGLAPSPMGMAPSPAGLAPSPAGLAPSPMGMAPSPAGLALSPMGMAPSPMGQVSGYASGAPGLMYRSGYVPCIIFEEFLVQEELAALLEFTLANEAGFSTSQVLSSEENTGLVSSGHRRSRILANPGKYQDIIVARIKSYFPHILQALHQPLFSASGVEVQITASNDGDFFKAHTDDGHISISSRQLTFVYFFYHEPKVFTGGDLRIYGADGTVTNPDTSRVIAPGQNRIVFFPSSLVHEVLPVQCPSQDFAHSRFTLNGWFHR